MNARVRAGWSRTAVPIAPQMSVLDVGSGAFPNTRATICVDREPLDNRHRGGADLVRDRPLVCADVMALPFRDGAFDFVIASHLAEHVEDPDGFCREVSRVAAAGYVETPSPVADLLLHEDYHLWRVSSRGDAVTFRWKPPRSRLGATVCDFFYRVYYAGQFRGERPTYRMPDNVVGRAARFVLYAVGGVLNRLGVMHTRVHFGPSRPLRCRTIR